MNSIRTSFQSFIMRNSVYGRSQNINTSKISVCAMLNESLLGTENIINKQEWAVMICCAIHDLPYLIVFLHLTRFMRGDEIQEKGTFELETERIVEILDKSKKLRLLVEPRLNC